MGIKENVMVSDARVFTLTLTLPSTSSGTNRERIGNESECPCGTEIFDSHPIVYYSGFPAGCEELAEAAV